MYFYNLIKNHHYTELHTILEDKEERFVLHNCKLIDRLVSGGVQLKSRKSYYNIIIYLVVTLDSIINIVFTLNSIIIDIADSSYRACQNVAQWCGQWFSVIVISPYGLITYFN